MRTCGETQHGKQQQIPAALLSLNLDPSTLPGPELRRNFRFPGAQRGNIPQSEELPRFIGVAHDDAGLRVVKELLGSLPAASRVGLEFDELCLTGTLVGRLLFDREISFTALGEYAKQIGLVPVCIERPSWMHPPENMRLLRKMSAVAKEWSPSQEATSTETRLLRRLWRLHDRMSATRGCKDVDSTRTSAWRSELMARAIARRGGWRSTDVVIVGTAHAINLARLFETRVSAVIGHYRSFEHFRDEIAPELITQAKHHTTVESCRKWHHRLHSLTLPLQALRLPQRFLGE